MQLTNPGRDRNRAETLECPLGRLFLAQKISSAEYQAGVKWRELYLHYLQSIGAPAPYGTDSLDSMSDSICEELAASYKRGVKILTDHGKRVLHAVNAVAVFEEPEELGDFDFTAKAAKKGLAALAMSF